MIDLQKMNPDIILYPPVEYLRNYIFDIIHEILPTPFIYEGHFVNADLQPHTTVLFLFTSDRVVVFMYGIFNIYMITSHNFFLIIKHPTDVGLPMCTVQVV